MLDQIANELIVASVIKKTNNISALAEELGYRPILLINALYKGSRDGKFKWDRKKDLLTIAEDVEPKNLAITEGLAEMREQIEMFIANINSDEKDLSIEELEMTIGGMPRLHIDICAFTSKLLSTYEYDDPGQKKGNATYTFLTLSENLGKQWASKQYNAKKSKAARLAQAKAVENEER
jgi:hypothetical protein